MKIAVPIAVAAIAAGVLFAATRTAGTPTAWGGVFGEAPLGVSVSDPGPNVSYATSGVHTTDTTVANGAGGTAPLAYAWTYVSGDMAISATNSSGAATAFTRSAAATASFSSVWRVTVTDAAARTANATVTVSFNGYGGGCSGICP